MPQLHKFQQAGLTVALLILAAVLESKAIVGAYKSVADHLAAFQYGALSASCALLAFIFSAVAGSMKIDCRPRVRRMASAARAVSIACLLIPIGTLASAFKYDRAVTEWPAYQASPAYTIDVATASAEVDLLDNVAIANREAAQRRIQEPTFVTATVLDFEFWLAAFLQTIVISGAGIRLSPPATEEERRHALRVAAGKKAAATRKRNKAKKAAKPALRVVSK